MGAVLDASRLDGRVALITGAGGGIGQATARAFAAAGASIALSDRPGASIATVWVGGARDSQVSLHEADVADQLSVDRLVDDVVRAHGRVDVLAHVAGMLDARPFLEIPVESWDRTFAVNTRGPFLVGQAVARRMVDQASGGRIVMVASNVARTPRLNNAAYAASKAAVVHLVRCMALELARYNITVNALCPGSTATPMLIDVQARGDPRRLDGIIRGSIEQWRTGIPLGRLAEPEEQAAMIAFLATDAGRYITGQALCVDGGQTLF
jgi:2,3-dihydro-2,3-dihydroxybenzoate dehydrogenase